MESIAWPGLVQALVKARRENQPADPSSWEATLAHSDDAYAVQQQVAEALGWFPDGTPRHWKSGGPSRGVVLTHAPLAPSGVRASPADFTDMRFNAPGIEAEIALRIGRDVTPAQAAMLTPESAAGLVDAMAVSIELVDSRWRDGPNAPALLRLADSQLHGALALGDWVSYAPAHDWKTQRCEVRIADRSVEKTGTHPLGGPAWLLAAWLRHATRLGGTVSAGSVVTTGSWCGILPIQPGETVMVSFPGIGDAELRI